MEKVPNFSLDGEVVCGFKWLARMNCYIEGSSKGYLKVRDVQRKGECLLKLQSDFVDRISSIQYSLQKNVLFVGSKDGKFKIWKVPNEWRQKWVEKAELE